MLKFPFGQQRIIDEFQRKLDAIEKEWPMTGSYARLDPYLIPYTQGGDYYQFLIYHTESKLWFDNTNADFIAAKMVSTKMIQEGDVAFDLGCNAGALTIIMARLAGRTGHIHAFDPYPWNAEATRCNAALNYLDNVTSYPIGLSNRSYRIKVSPNDSRIYEQSATANAQELRIESINRYMHLKPKFLKIDIEGAEHDLFEGQDPTVFKSVEMFALEFHPFWIRPRDIDPREALRSIDQAGFLLHYYDPNGPAYPIEHYDDSHHLFWGKKKQASEAGAVGEADVEELVTSPS